MGRHTIHISNHVLCPVCSDAREFLKGGVEIFELVKNEFRKLFPRRRMTDAVKDGELLHMFIKNESCCAGQHVLLLEKSGVNSQ